VEPWLQQIPATVRALADRWDLLIGEAIGRGNTSLVLRCRRADGRPAVLKLVPDSAIAAGEASALRAWAASGKAPLVWGFDEALGALLLEAMPSELPLAERATTVGAEVVVDLISALHRCGMPLPGGGVVPLSERVDFVFEHWVERQAQRGEAATAVVPLQMLHRGHELARELAGSSGVEVLLHGDLHPGNVLHGGSERGLVAIDPRPCVGDPAFDAVDWVFWGADDPREWPQRGRDLAARLGIDPGRLWAWCVALAPLLAAATATRQADRQRAEALLTLAS
jgi:streptomycin 6-kinase